MKNNILIYTIFIILGIVFFYNLQVCTGDYVDAPDAVCNDKIGSILINNLF